MWDWQCTPANVGVTLNKYSIVALLHKTTELCLAKPELIDNGSDVLEFPPGILKHQIKINYFLEPFSRHPVMVPLTAQSSLSNT